MVPNGAILRFHLEKIKQGTTSVVYSVEVYSQDRDGNPEKHIFSNCVTLVAVDEMGQKTALIPNED